MRQTIVGHVSLLGALGALFPESSRATLRQMLQSGRVRVNGEVEKDARRILEPDDVLDIAQKDTQRALSTNLLANALAKKKAQRAGADEVLLLAEEATEGKPETRKGKPETRNQKPERHG